MTNRYLLDFCGECGALLPPDHDEAPCPKCGEPVDPTKSIYGLFKKDDAEWFYRLSDIEVTTE